MAASFSTTVPKKSGEIPASFSNHYDPELTDMAKYVHQYNIDSDLAVSFENHHLLP
jgi:2-methylcitrate dehydratase